MSDRLAARTDSAEVDAAGTPRPVTLTELLAVPRRRWRWLLVFAAAGAATAIGFLTVLPADHTATSVVTVRPVVLDSFSYPGPGADRAVNMNVEHSLATSGRVVHAVARATGQHEQTVRDGLLVEVPVGGQLLRFGYTADSERTAITGANAAATAYLAGRRSDYEVERDTQLDSYDSSLAALTKKEQDAEKRAQKQAANSVTAASVTADDQVRALNDQISNLTEQRARIAAIDLTPGSVTNRAARPVPSSRDHGFLYLIAGVVGGALFGAVAGYARESGDRRVRRAADAAVAADAPLLGVVRRGRGLSSRAHRVDVAYLALAVADLAGPGTEGPTVGDGRPRRPVMLLSARADEGRADLSADLAVALAQHGERVYLGDVLGAGDQLRSRVLATVAARWGSAHLMSPPPTLLDSAHLPPIDDDLADLTDTAQLPVVSLAGTGTEDRVRATVTVTEPTPRRIVIANGSRVDDALTRDPIPVIAVGEGSVAVGPADAADPARLVLLDAPPTEFDPRGPGSLSDGLAVLVVARDRTRVSELCRAAERLRAAGHEPAGVVLIGGDRG